MLTALRRAADEPRRDLARCARAAPSTISGVVQDLVEAGLVMACRVRAVGRLVAGTGTTPAGRTRG